MSDSGKINIKTDFSKPSAAKTNAPSTNTSEKSSPKTKSSSSDIYKAATDSQEKLSLNKSNNNPETKLDPKTELKAKNPVLAEKLKTTDAKTSESTKEKSPAPKQSLRVKLSPKGYPINPRKVKPNIPGRLKAFRDTGISNIDRLAEVLGDKTSKEINSLYENKLLGDYMLNYQSSSIAELLKLDHSIFNQDLEFVIDFLSARAELLSEDKFLYDFLQNIVNILHQTQNPLQQILQLFLPFPLTFVIRDIDEEFEEDEDELHEDSQHGKDEDSSNEKEDEKHDEVSISVTTLNFNKIHFLIKFLKSSDTAKVYLKCDSTSSELSLPVAMAIEDALDDSLDDIEFEEFLWHKSPRIESDNRYLKVRHSGNLDSRMIDVTRAILQTIADNDICDDEDSDML